MCIVRTYVPPSWDVYVYINVVAIKRNTHDSLTYVQYINKNRTVCLFMTAQTIGPEKYKLLAFHVLKCCCSTSSLSGFTKKSSWKVFTEWYTLFDEFGSELTEDVMRNRETFIIAIYCDKKPTFQALDRLMPR